jgi:hypothetical protein
MFKANKHLVALALGLSAAAFASQATAQQQSAARDAAIHKCIAQARSLYPDPSQDQERTDLYKACMTTAGFFP